jgi:NTP pyrophosphatase (non-canonical NTP hydrolase)
MDIKELIQVQKEFDSQHGWVLESISSREKLEAINKDLIGLFGEIGEFANLVKKLNILPSEEKEEFEHTFLDFQDSLNEELIDSLIYLIRIATHLGLDIEEAYLKKLEINKEKYKQYENH